VRVCPACHRENPDDSDFCQFCGEYLRWDPTVATPAVRPPAGPDPGPEQVPPGMRPIPGTRGDRSPADAVSITLRSLTDDADPREGVRVTAGPGQTVSLVASIRNQSGIVDNYDLRVEGLPDGWWTITPATAYLVPYGAPSGRYEQDAQVHLHPPRAAQAEARDWPIRVVAASRATSTDAGSASARLTVAPYQEVETEMRPERATGRRRGKFAFAVRNLANAPIELEFSATDPEQKLKFAFKEKRGTARPGRRTGTHMIAKAGKTLWVGRPVDHPFEIAVRRPGSDDVVISRQAVFRQRPWIAWWVPIALVAIFGLGLAGYKLLQHAPTITVPKLEGREASVVQKYLEKFGLLLSSAPAKTKQVAASEAGKIVGQNPSPGVRLKAGQAVSVIVGVASKQVQVPNVCDQTLGAAQKALQAAGLSVGPVQPSAKDPNLKTLAKDCQQPAVGQSVAGKTPVSLFLEAPGGGGVPDVGNQPAAAAAKALQSQGLKTVIIPVLAPLGASQVGSVVAQKPGKGAALAKGSTVYLYVSTQPAVAYDDGTNVQLLTAPAGGAGQSKALTAAATGTIDTEPSWNADGTLIAYSSRPTAGGAGTIHVVAADGSDDRTVPGGGDYHRPAFAPLAGSGLLAFTQIVTGTGGGSTGALCVVNVPDTGTIATPVCTAPDPTYLLDRPTWSPDGLSIATVALDPSTSQPAGVRVFTAGTAFIGPWTPAAALSLQGKKPLSLAWSPSLPTGALLAYAAGPAIATTSTPASPGKALPPYAAGVQAALDWRADGVLVIGGLDCSSAPPAMEEELAASTTPPTPFPLSVNGCNPSAQPLPAPPPAG
jgi:beta-lactam-binding protein with PASTA domain